MLTGDRVLATTFTQTQFSRGYDERQVDEFLDGVVAALRAHEAGRPGDATVRSSDLASATFTQTRFSRGYDEREVDEFVRRVAAVLAHHEGRGGVPPAAPGASVPSGAPSVAGATAAPAREPLGRRLLRVLRGDPR